MSAIDFLTTTVLLKSDEQEMQEMDLTTKNRALGSI